MAVRAAVTQNPAGNLRQAKGKSTERIDLVAVIMAIGRAPCMPRRRPSVPSRDRSTL
jgi:hypothetical protein